jgi:hypothetical protein
MTLAGIVVLAGAAITRGPLRVSTDIVGYPIYYDYNINWIDDLYLLGFVVFPVVSIAIFIALERLAQRLGAERAVGDTRQEPLEADVADTPQTEVGRSASSLARMMVVAGILAVEGSVLLGTSGRTFWLPAAAVVGLYVVAVGLGAELVRRVVDPPTDLVGRVAMSNALLAPLSVLGLAGVSASTSVAVLSDASTHHYQWFPLWLAVPLWAIVTTFVWRAVNRADSELAVRVVERRVLTLLEVPIAIFLLGARIPGAIGALDAFHEGEYLAGSQLILQGFVPWRDLMSTHGLLEDSLLPLAGSFLIQSSRWGVEAGRILFLVPLTFISFYFLFLRLFRWDWAFLALLVVLMPDEHLIPFANTRFVFWPLVLILFSVCLNTRKVWVSAVLGAVLVVQAILVPEAAYCIPACGAVLVLYEWTSRSGTARLAAQFSRTLACAAGGLVAVLLFIGVLLWQHALGNWIFYYETVASGHALTGGLPVVLHRSSARIFIFEVVATTLALAGGMLYFAATAFRRRRLTNTEWVVAASGLFALLYFPKLLDRFDLGHSLQTYVATVPLMAFLAYRATQAANDWVRRQRWGTRIGSWTRRPASIAVLCLAVVTMQVPLPVRFDTTSTHYRVTANAEPSIPRLGYGSVTADAAEFADLRAVLHAYLGPSDWVYDFTNAPAVYYYLLELTPRTRYFDVSVALPETSQQDLVGQLERDRPKLVIFDSDRWGQPGWDGIPNQVRHYDVSQYLLDHYRPLLMIDGQIIYADATAGLSAGAAEAFALNTPLETSGLAFAGQVCNWGFAPNFLAISSPAGTSAPASLVPTPDGVSPTAISGWAVDPTMKQPAREVVVVAGNQVVGHIAPDRPRPDVASSMGLEFSTSGFNLTVNTQSLQGANGLLPVRLYGVSDSGIASPLPFLGTQDLSQGLRSPSTLLLDDGSSVIVRPGAVTGFVDALTIGRAQSAITLPAGQSWADYRWLSISTVGGFQGEQWSIGDSSDPSHTVTFNSLPTNHALRVHVGSCAQWHGYETPTLYITHTGTEAISVVNLS